MTLTLRIKKEYYHQIAKGVKNKEYRQNNEYYRVRLKKNYSHLKIHYQKKGVNLTKKMT